MKKKLLVSTLILVFVLSFSGIASAAQKPINMSFKGGLNTTVIPFNQPVIATVDYSGVQGKGEPTWTALYRVHWGAANCGYADVIEYDVKVKPWNVGTKVKWATEQSPLFYELLAVNGVPWQIFDAPDIDQCPAAPEGSTLRVSDEIHEYETDGVPGTAYRSVLPTGNQKMVSLFADDLVAAYYTASTVKADFFPARPFEQNGVLYVPLRGTADYLGSQISYNNKTGQIAVSDPSKGITATIKTGSKTYKINGMTKTMDAAPQTVNGTTMVPVSFLNEMGYQVKNFSGKYNNITKVDIYN